ncbi:hypothetical protein [Amycolatopsis tolypomycina]|uniref:hypothetical protein n=1 Tax=Amycolatopsis tolypomycina TaxID=208445 RepID=UPI000B8A5C7A|nr:hypothetical protein [Amycolatopsis tolypomycina]
MSGEFYDGIPLELLLFEEVRVPDPTHLRRSLRYRGALDIEPEHAVEAALDPRRLVGRDPSSRTGESIRVVGYSAGMGRLLTVVLLPDRHPPDGVWQIATAWPTDKRVRQAYQGLWEVS